MELLKKIWPFSFDTNKVSNLVIKAIVYVLIGVIFSVLIGLLRNVPVLNVIFYIVGPLVDLYVIAGLVVMFLNFFKVLK